VRAALALLALLAVLPAASGCNGESTASTQPLTETAFKDKVAAAIITGTDLDAATAGGLTVNVAARTTLNTLSLQLTKPFAEYKAAPGRLDAIVSGLVENAETQMTEGNAKATFAEVRSLVLPVLKPGIVARRLTDEPASMSFPGNLHVVYVVQRPHAVLTVTQADAARWQRPPAEIHRIALDNLFRETRREQPLRCEQKLCGWASGDGYDAARMLVPELRRAIVREIGPAVYAVPRESVYVALPIKLADRIRGKVVRDFVTAPNPVSSDLFVERGGELVVLPK
jgi:hypothetical protein